MARVLFVVSSCDRMGESGRKTGLWLEEYAAPWEMLSASGCEIVTASPRGGVVPLDPDSLLPENADHAVQYFLLKHRILFRHAEVLEKMRPGDFDALFFPGGHGPMWDLAENPFCVQLLNAFLTEGKLVAAVCHGCAALLNCPALLAGRRVTGFSNQEERLNGTDQLVPFLLEERLKEAGAVYSCGEPWQCHVRHDGSLITGQNPTSARAAARELLRSF